MFPWDTKQYVDNTIKNQIVYRKELKEYNENLANNQIRKSQDKKQNYRQYNENKTPSPKQNTQKKQARFEQNDQNSSQMNGSQGFKSQVSSYSKNQLVHQQQGYVSDPQLRNNQQLYNDKRYNSYESKKSYHQPDSYHQKNSQISQQNQQQYQNIYANDDYHSINEYESRTKNINQQNNNNQKDRYIRQNHHNLPEVGIPFVQNDEERDNSSNRQKQYAEDLKRQIQERERIKQKEKRQQQEELQEMYAKQTNPFGRGGSGAPIYNDQGKLITNVRSQNHENLSRNDDYYNNNSFSASPNKQNEHYNQDIDQPKKTDYNPDEPKNTTQNMFTIISTQHKHQDEVREKRRLNFLRENEQMIEQKKLRQEEEKRRQAEEDIYYEQFDREEMQQRFEDDKNKYQDKGQQEKEIKSVKKLHQQKKMENLSQLENKYTKDNTRIVSAKTPRSNAEFGNISHINEKRNPDQDKETFELDKNDKIEEAENFLDNSLLDNQNNSFKSAQQGQSGDHQLLHQVRSQDSLIQQQQYEQRSQQKSQQQYHTQSNFQNNIQQHQDRIGHYNLMKQEEELMKLKDSLQMQTSMLSNEMRQLRYDAQLAQEMKRSAVNDLQNLREKLKRDEMFEQMRLNEIRNKMMDDRGQFDYLVMPNNSQSVKSLNSNYPNYYQAQEYNRSSKRDILDEIMNSNSYNNQNMGYQSNYQTHGLDSRINSRFADLYLGKTDMATQEIDNLLLSIKN